MATQKKFDVTSPGFLYSAIVAVLTIFAVSGVQLPSDPATLGQDFVTTLSTGGVIALGGVILASLIFPIYNFVKGGGKFTWAGIFGKTLTWVALGNAALSAIALSGWIIPPGTVEQVIAAVQTKDWMGLISVLALTVGTSFIRWIKEKKAQQEAAK